MANREEYRDETQRDDASRFFAKQYISTGCNLHFHRNIEIYGIVSGKASVTIAGQQRILEQGQIAIIHGLENHCSETDGSAEVFSFQIGTRYASEFYRVYPKNRLPRWLLDTQYNQMLYDRIKPLLNTAEPISELKRIVITCQLFSDIIDRYGMEDVTHSGKEDSDLVLRVIQYIYDHYHERITLDILAEKFYLSPKALSKRIKKHINMDFRIFVNDIRIQYAVQMRDDPKNQGKSLEEIAAACGFTNMGTFYRSYERNFKLRKLDGK